MNLGDELRALQAPGATPDLVRAVMARIERAETTDVAVRADEARTRSRGWTTWLAPAGVAAGVVLILFSGVIATATGPVGRMLSMAMPAVSGAQLGPWALLAGLFLYVSSLWAPIGRARRT